MSELDEIKQRIDIISFLGDYLTLKKAGRNYKALCPFHSEKTPSFVISPERQIWHCFGACGEGGDIFTFLMKVENLEFPEALEILANKAGVKLTKQYRVTQNQKLKEDIFNANRLASNFYHFLLTSHKVGEKARKYLEERKINKKVIDTFALGYAPEDWESLVRFLKKKSLNDYLLTKSGLAISGRGGRLYDRFRGRLIFTLRDHRGNVVGFSGRSIPETEARLHLPPPDSALTQSMRAGSATADGGQAKYINTAETPVYIKGNLFYGLDITREAIRRAGEAIIVEGEFDFLSSFQAGVTNIVAIKGTALTANQVNLLKRFTETIAIALDQDIAGDQAARRGIEIAENAGLNIKVVNTPLGKDPDECIRKDPSVWKKAVSESISVYDFILESALKRFDKNQAFGKKKIVDELIPFYAKISNTIVQSHYLSLLAKRIETPQERLAEVIERFNKGKPTTIISPVTPPEGKKRNVILEEYFLSLLLQTPTIALIQKAVSPEESEKVSKAIENPAVKKITLLFFSWINKLKNESPKSAQFIKTLAEELISHADKAYLLELGEIIEDKTLFQRELLQTKHDLYALYLRRRMKELATKIKEVKDEADIEVLNEKFKFLKENLKELDRMIIK